MIHPHTYCNCNNAKTFQCWRTYISTICEKALIYALGLTIGIKHQVTCHQYHLCIYQTWIKSKSLWSDLHCWRIPWFSSLPSPPHHSPGCQQRPGSAPSAGSRRMLAAGRCPPANHHQQTAHTSSSICSKGFSLHGVSTKDKISNTLAWTPIKTVHIIVVVQKATLYARSTRCDWTNLFKGGVFRTQHRRPNLPVQRWCFPYTAQEAKPTCSKVVFSVHSTGGQTYLFKGGVFRTQHRRPNLPVQRWCFPYTAEPRQAVAEGCAHPPGTCTCRSRHSEPHL